MEPFWFIIIGILLLTAVVGYLVSKSEAKADARVESVATDIKALAKNTKEQRDIEGVKFPWATFVADHLGKVGFVLSLTKTHRPMSIRKVIQDLSLKQVDVLKIGRDPQSYPNFVVIAIKTAGMDLVIKGEERFLQKSQVKEEEFFDIWAEEDGPNKGELWTLEDVSVYHSEDCDDSCSFEIYAEMKSAFEEAAVNMALRKTVEGELNIFNLRTNQGYTTTQLIAAKRHETPVEILNTSYAKITLGSKEFKVTEAINKVAELAPKARAVLTIEGPTGTGKTRLMKTAAAIFTDKNEGLQILQWQAGTGVVNATDTIQNMAGRRPILLLMEDAHLLSVTEMASLLNLLDGMTTPENLHAIISYNKEEAPPEVLKQLEALHREGRTTINIHLSALDQESSKGLMEAIRTFAGEHKEIEGAVAKLPEKATVAQIWGCFAKKSILDLI